MTILNKMMSLLGLQDDDSEPIQTESSSVHADAEANAPAAPRKSATVVSLHSNKQVKVVLCEAKQFDDAQIIADHMRSRRPVVINLHKAPYEIALRILDFISGTTYALGGRMEKLGQNVFLCAPENVEIQGAISEWLEAAAAQSEDTRQTGK